MSTLSKSARRALALATAVAVGAVGTAAVPAVAVRPPQLQYDCSWPGIADFETNVEHEIVDSRQDDGKDDPTPTLGYGHRLKNYADIFLPTTAIDELRAAGVAAFTIGTSTEPILLGGTTVTATGGFNRYRPKTRIPESGWGNVYFASEADTTDVPAAVGDRLDLAMVDVDAAEIAVQLTTYDANDNKLGTPKLTCELADSQDLTTDFQFQITKASTKTGARLRYDTKAGKLVSTAFTYAPFSSALATGDVRYTLKRNGKTIKTLTKTLEGEPRTITTKFDGPKKGTYELLVAYLGDDAGNFKPSQKVATLSF